MYIIVLIWMLFVYYWAGLVKIRKFDTSERKKINLYLFSIIK